MSPIKRYATRSSVNSELGSTELSSSSLFKDIPKLRKLSKGESNSRSKQGVLADTTNSSSNHRMSLRSQGKLEVSDSKMNPKKRLSSECDIEENKSSSLCSSSSYSCLEETAVAHHSRAQSPQSPTKKRSISKDKVSVVLPAPRCLDLSLFMCYDGNGDILREILSYFYSPFEATGNEALDLLRDTLSMKDIISSFFTCKLFAEAIEKTMSFLLLPSLNVSFVHPRLDFVPPKSRFVNFFQFCSLPERRIRSFTFMDTMGKESLDDLYTNPVFCVRYRGIRQGKQVHSSLGSTAAHWPLQLHTFFKMRTYTKFDRLMNVYAQRSYLPLPWLDFQVTDRFYKKQKKPILQHGETIKSSHNLWTIGMEPKLEGDNSPEEPEAMTDEDPDIWVDSYLNCAEDECFVCIRDCRSIANLAPLRISWPRRCEEGAHEGPLLGDGAISGASGQCGRFVQGDASSNSLSSLNAEEPGQPVRPRHPGWMFKVKQRDPLQPLMDRVTWEVKTTLFRSEDIDTSTPVEFRSIATTTFGNERYRVVDGNESAVEATSRTIYGDMLPSSLQSLPLHVLELRDLIEPVNNASE